MKSEVAHLGRNVLSPREFNEAFSIAELYQENRVRAHKRFFALDKKIGIPVPSHTGYPVEYRGVIRPIHFYCKFDIKMGIRFPRNFVENVCGHTESCVKLVLEKFDPTARTNISLGPLLARLERFSISKGLILKLKKLNRIVYVRAKHDWNIPLRPQIHLFDVDDAIMIYFIARKLAKKIFAEGNIKPDVLHVTSDDAP